MSNDVAKGLLLASGLFILSSPALADPQADCASLDSSAAQNSSLTTPPGYCTLYNANKTAEDQFAPPGACADYDALATFTLGTPAVLQNCGATATMPGSTAGTGIIGTDTEQGGSTSSSSTTGRSSPTTLEEMITGTNPTGNSGSSSGQGWQ